MMQDTSSPRVPARPRRKFMRLLASAAVGAMALTSCGVSPDTTTLKLADSYSTVHPFARYGVGPFVENLKASGIDVEYFPSGQMGNAQDLMVLAQNDVADIVPASPAYLEDEFPLSSVSDLPSMTDDACVAADSMMDLLGPDGILYESEYKPRGLRPLWIAIIPGYEVMTADRPVLSPEDVRGLLLRSSGGAFDVTMEAIGASPVSMSAGDTYEAIARRTVDGTAMPFVSVPSYNLEEVVRFTTEGLNLGSVGIPYVISEDSWAELSSSEQELVAADAKKTNQSLCEGINAESSKNSQLMKDAGVVFTPIEGPDVEAWDSILADVRTTWASSLDGIGLPGTDVLQAYEKALADHEK